jgi:hypothetical protein
MTRDELVTASEALDQAASDVDAEHRERIEDQSEALMSLAERELGPDQGRLDRHMNILSELYDETGNEDVERALEQVREYRTGVGGV